MRDTSLKLSGSSGIYRRDKVIVGLANSTTGSTAATPSSPPPPPPLTPPVPSPVPVPPPGTSFAFCLESSVFASAVVPTMAAWAVAVVVAVGVIVDVGEEVEWEMAGGGTVEDGAVGGSGGGATTGGGARIVPTGGS